MGDYIVWLADSGAADLPRIGGKNASLGEMICKLSRLGICVPDGFATTAEAYQEFLRQDGLIGTIEGVLKGLDINDVDGLAHRGAEIRNTILSAPLPTGLRQAVSAAWHELCENKQVAVAVRSSATSEDLPEASFAGQQKTLLNVTGLSEIMSGIHEVYASMYNDRAIAYRVHLGLDDVPILMSVGVQRMVRADVGSAGVVFTLDTESGFRDVVFITSSYGLGESVVQGVVNPDEFYVYKPALRTGKYAIVRRTLGSKARKLVYGHGSDQRVRYVDVDHADQQRFSLRDEDILELARQALIIEDHYGCPMDIEWAKDGVDGKLYILQARPETVQSRQAGGNLRYALKERGRVLARGRSIGQRIGSGRARIVDNAREMNLIQQGDVLVTDMTDPDWEPVMQRAAAIVTDRGGRTCHAAIIARELGVPAVVGCGDATASILDGREVTVSCAEGDEGIVYAGKLDFEQQNIEFGKLPDLPVNLMMNVGNPDRAFAFASTPNQGVGLARLEFIINRTIGVHPLAILEYDKQDPAVRDAISQQMAGYPNPVVFFIEKLAEGIATIAAAFAPHPVILRLSDFKSNEYANLIGGDRYEPREANPMLGFRGASRYVDKEFRRCFRLECRAVKRVREEMGLSNVQVMVPFVRTVDEADKVIRLLDQNGLKRGEHGLSIYIMCEIPSNVLLADQFLEYFDGMSIGSNDMTQLTLGLDRDSARVASLFDERDPAVKQMLSTAIAACRAKGKYVGICGQGPSDYPDLALWLVEQGIDSISLSPDTVVSTWLYLGKSLAS
ncbi:phosphoenolpyruvate synthase [Candidatus Rariloculus sp.]|uniref:phosphoenolpyruvate synthase n=1 Tax=Candidatus Rariloculus sp. TaxID=3101265 RepID=UPI003D12976A